MSARLLLALVTFLAISRTAEGLCCDKIRSKIEGKTRAYKTLCTKYHVVPKKCCKEITDQIKRHQDAFKDLCVGVAVCNNPKALGMESGKIADSAITASSSCCRGYQSKYARLRKALGNGGWLAKSSQFTRHKAWLQVDLGRQTVLTAVATQGSANAKSFVKTYIITYSKRGTHWWSYKELGKHRRKIFVANSDHKEVKTHYFQRQVIARYVRIQPLTYKSLPQLRVEYYGCPVGK